MMFKYKNQSKIVDTTIDKSYTSVANYKAIKEALKEFSQVYTCGDLLRELNEQSGQDIYGNILKCTVEAFENGFFSPEPRFNVCLLVDSYNKIYDINFYCDKSLTINTDPKCITVDTYVKVKD